MSRREGGVRQTVPRARDRMQSDLLVGAVGLLLVLKVLLVSVAIFRLGPLPRWFWIAWAVSAVFALGVWLLRSATGPAAALGGVICCNVLLAQVHGESWWQTGLPELLALFLLTFAATRFGRQHKERLGTAEPREGRRAAQVVANLVWQGCAPVRPRLCSSWLVLPRWLRLPLTRFRRNWARCLAVAPG